MKRLPPDIFGAVTEAKLAARRAGEDIVDLGLGNPDMGTPRHIVEKLLEASQKEINHRYSASRGLTRLRSAISDWYDRRYGVSLDPEAETVVTMGAREGLTHLALAVLEPGESVLLPDPTSPIHSCAILVAGGEPLGVPIGPGRDFFAELQRTARKAIKKPRMLLISFPHNPTGEVAELDFFEKAVDFCREHAILLVHDLAHADLRHDGHRAPSLLQVKGARDIGVELFSMSKSYSMAGWRIGYVSGNRKMIAALTRLKSCLDYDGAFQPIQIASALALSEGREWADEIAALYRERRDVLAEGLRGAGWPVPSPQGGMFIWAEIPEPFKAPGSVEFAKTLIREAKTAVSPGLGFGAGGEGYVRFALVENVQRIQQAVRGIRAFLANDLSK